VNKLFILKSEHLTDWLIEKHFKHYLLERVGSTNAYDMDHNSDEYLWLVAMVKKIEDYEMSKQVYAIQKAMGFVRD
jgi:hypothetical protein